MYEINQQVDISGECHVTYQRLNESHLSKVKSSCRSLYAAGTFQQVNQVSIIFSSSSSSSSSSSRALWRSGLSARVPKCQKLKNSGLDQYNEV